MRIGEEILTMSDLFDPGDFSLWPEMFGIDNILNSQEASFYKLRWTCYTREHPELNGAEDADDLHLLIMEMVMQQRLLKKMKSDYKPSTHDKYTKSIARYNSLRKNLFGGVNRERSTTGTDIASLSAKIEAEKKDRRLEDEKQEEAELQAELDKEFAEDGR
jgi:hypothetical protein